MERASLRPSASESVAEWAGGRVELHLGRTEASSADPLHAHAARRRPVRALSDACNRRRAIATTVAAPPGYSAAALRTGRSRRHKEVPRPTSKRWRGQTRRARTGCRMHVGDEALHHVPEVLRAEGVARPAGPQQVVQLAGGRRGHGIRRRLREGGAQPAHQSRQLAQTSTHAQYLTRLLRSTLPIQVGAGACTGVRLSKCTVDQQTSAGVCHSGGERTPGTQCGGRCRCCWCCFGSMCSLA